MGGIQEAKRREAFMADQAETVDSVKTDAAVDAATANVEIPPAEESSKTKTFTAEEVDAIVKGRIDKARAKHDAEVDELRKQIEGRDEELKAYKAAEAVAKTRAEVAAEYDVDASMLDGETEAEVRAQARVLKSVPKFPSFRDSGETKVAAPTKESILSIQDSKKRLQAIRENAELFSD